MGRGARGNWRLELDATGTHGSAALQGGRAGQIQADAETATKVIKMIDAIEDLDDVQSVFTNMDISPEVLAALEA